ncbi:hypothetical protein [Microbacterium sp. NPDC077486]|uniref:hypothetical protein n=1 Tax=Microbacterium sp. NPDC077486 TaxID=3154766 RepID=UPI00341A25DC
MRQGDLFGFWSILRPLMFGGPSARERWEDERVVAQRWATTNLPWGHGIRERCLAGVPTLVVTGGWNEEYEIIASRLVDVGADHMMLPGYAHRPARPSRLPDCDHGLRTLPRDLTRPRPSGPSVGDRGRHAGSDHRHAG